MKFGLLHPRAVARAIYYGQRWRLKRWLGIPDRPRAPVLHGGLDQAVERYRRICRTLLPHLASRLPKNFVAAEIGCGDCLAAADMMLGLGAQHVNLVEHQAMPLTALHRQALSRTISPDLPNRASILSSDDPPRLTPALATLHVGLLENLSLPQPVDLVYFFDVLEHVEDLDEFFSCCSRTLKPGGLSLHKFDLSGHEFFEGSMPPLDLQTFARWLYRLMFARYRRAVENFADLFFDLMRKNGIEILEIVPLRVTGPNYLREIRPQIRKEAQLKSDGTLMLLDLVIVARKR